MKRTLGQILPFLLAAMAVAGLMVVAGTSLAVEDAGAAPNDLGDPVTIVFWHQHTGAREVFMQQLIDEFNDANTYSITVVGQYAGGYNTIYDAVLLGLQGGGPLPNMVASYQNQIADYARYGAVRFLDEYFEDPVVGVSDPDDLYPGVVSSYRLAQYGDQLAGLQNGISIEVMYYNADLLAGAGQGIPLTWEDFEAACMDLTTDTVWGTIPGGDPSRFATWLWSRGGELLSEDASSARFQEQEGIDSLQLFQDLFDGGYARPVQESYDEQNSFCNGEVGFVFASSAGIPYYRSGMESGADDEWGVTRVPAVPGNEVTDAYGAGIAVLRNSEDEDRAAWLFLRWLTEADQTARWAAMSGYFPVRISAADHVSMTEKLAEDVQYAQAYALLPLGRSEPAVRNYQAVRGILGEAISMIFYDSADVEATLEAAAAEVDALLEESGPTTEVIPADGGTLIYTYGEGGSVTLEFPQGAVEEDQIVSYVPLDDLPTDGLAFALVPNLTFGEPVMVTIHYLDSDVVGMDEDRLKLYTYDWTSASWVDADPCGGYVRDPLNNILQAGVCHFSDYALIGWPHSIYLPIVLRNW